ncbi:MAG: hypothetical protein WBF43_05890, partial [Methylocella sp.]
ILLYEIEKGSKDAFLQVVFEFGRELTGGFHLDAFSREWAVQRRDRCGGCLNCSMREHLGKFGSEEGEPLLDANG